MKSEPYVPQSGDIGIVTMPGAVGKIIRIAQWLNGGGFHNYEHAFVVVGPDDPALNDGSMIVEAMPGGALLSALSRYDGLGAVYLRCPDHLRADVTAATIALEGVPYSFLDYLALAAHRMHIPVPGLRSYIYTSRHAICSQLADRAADNGGWHLFDDGRWEGYVTPADLYRLYTVQQLTVPGPGR